MNYGIMYKATDNLQLIGYIDSDWAGCLDDRRSTTGMCSCWELDQFHGAQRSKMSQLYPQLKQSTLL